jgi:hypothetical protein
MLQLITETKTQRLVTTVIELQKAFSKLAIWEIV